MFLWVVAAVVDDDVMVVASVLLGNGLFVVVDNCFLVQ